MKRHILRLVVHVWLIAAATAAPVFADDSGRGGPANSNWFAQGLEDLGINFRGSEIDQWARNPSGGVAEGDTNVGQLQFGADLDLKRLLGIDGGSFHFVIYRDYGQALNQNFTGTFTKQQYIYKNAFPQLHLGLFAYEQKLLDERLDIQLGRLGSTTYYGHLVTNCQFMSGTTCGEPRMLVAETGLSLLPSATWGTNIKFRPTPHTYVESGIFEVNPTTAPSNGLHFSVAQATGYTVPTEVAWVNADPNTTRYPFELKAGAYVSTAPLADPYYNTAGLSRGLHGGTALTDSHVRDGVYVMGDRVIWRPDADRPTSINVFGGVVQQLEEAEIMRQQIYTGFVWTAPSSYRPKDSLGLSISEFELTPGERYFLRDARIKAGGSGTNAAHQIAYDLTYSLHLWRGVELMPSLQYIQHPDNSVITKTTSVPANLFVYGIGLRMDLGYMAGFMRGGPSD
jgi:porin